MRHLRPDLHLPKTQFLLFLKCILSLIEQGFFSKSIILFLTVLIIRVLTDWDSPQKVTYVEHF